MPAQPVVAEEDQFGNVITTDSTLTVTATPGTQGTASLQGSNLTVTLASGVATFSGLSYDKAETMNIQLHHQRRRRARRPRPTMSWSARRAASQLVITQQPSATATAGCDFVTQPVVKEEDAFGNIITTDSTSTVTAARGSHGHGQLAGQQPDGDAGQWRGDLQRPVVQQGRDHELLFTTNAGGVTAATSNDIVGQPGRGEPAGDHATALDHGDGGVAFATQPVVAEEDQFGNVISSDSTHTVTAPRGNHGTASLQGSTLTVTLANGVATFSGLSYNKAETMNILFTTNAGGVATTTSNDVAVSPTAASQLVVTHAALEPRRRPEWPSQRSRWSRKKTSSATSSRATARTR